MKKQVAVTGGAGFIGSNLTIELVKKGYEVTVIDNLATGRAKNLDLVKNKIRLVKADVTDTKLLTKTFKGASCIFHEAAVPSVPRSIANPMGTHHANATGTLSVLLAARNAGVPRVVYASSSSVYGDDPTLPKHEKLPPKPLSPYAATKLLGEIYCKQFYTLYGLETVSLRYFNVFGPRQDPTSQYAAVIPKFITLIKNSQRPTIFGDGTSSRDFTFVENVVHANLLAMNAKKAAGEIFNIACGQRITLNQLFTQLKKLLKKNVKPKYEKPRPGDIPHSLADISKARKLLKYKPIVSFSDGLKKTVEWFNA